MTCIDSSKDIKSTIPTKKIIEEEGFCSFLGDGLLIGNGRILNVGNFFYGSDEIWLFKTQPVLEKPKEISILSTLGYWKGDPSKELLEWFEASGCVLGLGDGIGMHYLTSSKEIVESLNIRQQEFDSEVEGGSKEGDVSKE